MKAQKRVILAITGASGAIYGLKAIDALQDLNVEVHLIISQMGVQVIAQETKLTAQDLHKRVDHVYQPEDLSAPIASGSFTTDGMLLIPCSIKTLSGIANSYAENLVQRAADVCLKEGRPLLLALRETPLHAGHLQLMVQASTSGAIIYPLAPAFYNRPQTIDELVDATVGRMLARLGIENSLYQPWDGQNH